MEDLATLGIAVESSSVPTADQRLSKLSTTAAATERSTKSLADATVDLGTKAEATARRLSQYDDAHAKSARSAAMAADATNRAAATQAAAVRAAGSEVTRQYASMTSAAQRYAVDMSRTVEKIKIADAYQASITAARTYTAEVGRAVAMTNSLAAAQARVATPSAAVGYMSRPGQVGLNPQQRVMLGYQLQDVFTSLASGMNPAVVAAQQGPQISMLYGGFRNMLGAIPKPLLIGGGVAAAGVGGVLGVNALAGAHDELRAQDRRFGNMLGGDGAGMMRDIGRMASAASVGIDQATESVEGFAKATRGLGAARQDVLGITESMEKLIKLSGSNDNEAGAAREGVAGMLKQATVNADQLKAVLANAPRIVDQIAAGLGVSVTQLRLMADTGDLTNRQVLDAMVKRSTEVNAEFAAMPKSVGDLFSSIGTDLGMALKNLADSIPLVNQYRNALELAAKAAKAIRDSSAGETAQQVIARTSGAGAGVAPIGLAPGLSPGAAAGSMIAQRDFYAAQFDAAADEVQRWAAGVRSAVKAADEALVSAAGVARKFDPLGAEFRDNQRDIDAMEKALANLQAGLTNLSASEAANQIGILTNALERAREAAQNIDPALKSLNDISRRNDFRANDNTPAGMAFQGRVQDLVNQGANRQNAESAALAEQQEKIADIIKAKQEEAAASDKITAAMGRGKKALIEAQVEAAVLAFIMANVGKNTEGFVDEIKAFRDAVKTIFTNENTQAGINAAKPLQDELAAIAEAMKVVEKGAYAMKRAEAEARATRDENGTGGLQMQVFDARQQLTDATMLSDLKQEVELTNKLAAAAGDVAKQKALQLDYDIKRTQQNADPSNAEKIAAEMRAKAAAETRRETAEGAAEIEKQIELVKQQVDIVRSGNADYAAQLAMLQKKNDLLAKGVDLASDEAQRQIAGAGNLAKANVELDRAKEAAEATKRIWMNAFDGVQSYGADVFFDIFRGVSIDGRSAADSLKNIFLRAFAEIAAAAIIRPIVAPIFNAVGSAFGAGSAMSAATGMSGSGGGGLSIPSFGGGGGLGNVTLPTWLGGGQPFAFLNQPIFGPNLARSGADIAFAPTQAAMSSAMANSSGWLNNITWGQGLGAAAGIGMGAYQLLSGKGSTASTIGGIGSMIGGAVSLIPGVGQIAGPAIAILSSILPSLFGEQKPTITNREFGELSYGANGFTTSGGAWGPSANAGNLQGPLGGIGKTMDSIYRAFGGVKDAGKVWGVALQSFSQQYGDGNSFSGQTSFLVGPNGQRRQWGQGSNASDIGMEAAGVAATLNSILGGAVGELSANMRTALEGVNKSGKDTFDTLSTTVAEVMNFDDTLKNLGKTTTDAESALKQIDESFKALYDTADKYGLDTKQIDVKKLAEQQRVGTDFADSIKKQLLGIDDPLTAALNEIGDERTNLLRNNSALMGIKDFQDQTVAIEELYAKKRANIIEDYTKQTTEAVAAAAAKQIQSFQDVIDRLTYGDLSNASPDTAFAGAKATYMATLAQSRAGNADATDRLAGVAADYAAAGQSYYASGSDYAALNAGIRADLRERQGAAAGAGGNNEQINALMRAYAQQAEMFNELQATLRRQSDEISSLTAELRRAA